MRSLIRNMTSYLGKWHCLLGNDNVLKGANMLVLFINEDEWFLRVPACTKKIGVCPRFL